MIEHVAYPEPEFRYDHLPPLKLPGDPPGWDRQWIWPTLCYQPRYEADLRSQHPEGHPGGYQGAYWVQSGLPAPDITTERVFFVEKLHYRDNKPPRELPLRHYSNYSQQIEALCALDDGTWAGLVARSGTGWGCGWCVTVNWKVAHTREYAIKYALDREARSNLSLELPNED